MSKYFYRILIVGFVLFLLGCASTPENNQTVSSLTSPLEGTYSTTGGWGTVTLWKSAKGFEGTYTDTWKADTGDLRLMIENGKWVGEWEEPVINRGGELYDIVITNEGALITGLAKTTREGGHSSFEDEQFVWKKE